MHILAAIILISIVLTARLVGRWSLPLVLISLAAGILFGSDVLGLIYFDNAVLAKALANTALVFVLFNGGFGTKKDNFKMVMVPALVLSTLGIVITGIVTGVSLWGIVKENFLVALLLGVTVASTDAAAVFSILRTHSLPGKLSALTEVESATNDPMAIVLTTIMIQIMTVTGTVSPVNIGLRFVWQLAGGVGTGLLSGSIGCFLFRHTKANDKGYFYILIIGVVLLAYGFAETIKVNGMLSAFLAGYVMGNATFPFKRNIETFLEALSTISNVVIFVLLGLLVFPAKLGYVWIHGVLLFAVLTFIARPLTVFICTSFTKMHLKEKLFLSWGGLRGAVPVVLATYPAAANLKEADLIFNTVFFAVLLSLVIQGLSLNNVAKLLGLTTMKLRKPDQVMELVTIHESDLELYQLAIDDQTYSGTVPISSLDLPADANITMINRKEKIIVPRGGIHIYPGDIIYILTPTQKVEQIIISILSHFQTKTVTI